jgi:hypothetical protein
MSRCDFGGMIILPANITLPQFEWMLTICQLNSLPGIIPTSTGLCIFRYTCYDIRLDIFMAGKKNTDGRKVFRFMKSEESMVGEDSELEETCAELGGTHFMIRKIKFR